MENLHIHITFLVPQCLKISSYMPNRRFLKKPNQFLKNGRPSTDDIPEDIAPFLQSCWAEGRAARPEFLQITEFLAGMHQGLCSTQITPPQTFEIEHPRSNLTADSASTNRPISNVNGVTKQNKTLD